MAFLFFGQIKKVKGLDVLLKALAILNKSEISFRLTIAGKVWQDSFEHYQQIIDEQNLASVIDLHLQYIPDEEMWNYFNDANLVVLPYKKIYQSGVLLMAMSFGRAVLASDLPAFAEVINPGENGFLFQSEDSVALAAELSQIIQQRDILSRIEDKAYRSIKTEFDWTRIAMETRKVYDGVLCR